MTTTQFHWTIKSNNFTNCARTIAIHHFLPHRVTLFHFVYFLRLTPLANVSANVLLIFPLTSALIQTKFLQDKLLFLKKILTGTCPFKVKFCNGRVQSTVNVNVICYTLFQILQI